jgi:NADH dehydrogenase FAD-containing subunit
MRGWLLISRAMIDVCRSLRNYAERKFARDKVKIKGGTKISAVGRDWLEINGQEKGTS